MLGLLVKFFLNIGALIDSAWQLNGFKGVFADLAEEMARFILVMLDCVVDESLGSCKVDVHSVVLVLVRNHKVDQYVDEVGARTSSGHFDVGFWVRGGSRVICCDHVDFVEELRLSVFRHFVLLDELVDKPFVCVLCVDLDDASVVLAANFALKGRSGNLMIFNFRSGINERGLSSGDRIGLLLVILRSIWRTVDTRGRLMVAALVIRTLAANIT